MGKEKTKKKAECFIELLAKKLSQEKNCDALKTKFNESVSDLCESKLKRELTSNLEQYSAIFVSNVSEVQSTAQRTQEDGQNGAMESYLCFNLYSKRGTVMHHSVSSLPQPQQDNVYNVFLSKQFGHSDVSDVLNGVSGEQGDAKRYAWLDQLHRLSAITCGNSSPEVLQQLMMRGQQHFAAFVDECIEDKKHKGAKKISRELMNFLILCDFRRKEAPQPFVSSPTYSDLVAALLSSYLDVSLMVYRRLESVEASGKQLALAVTYLLRSCPTHVLDVIVQTANITAEDASFLGPLIRHAFDPRLINHPSCPVYVKFVAAVRHVTSCLPMEICVPVRKEALTTPAPDNFLSWLVEKDESILDELPVTRHFSGVEVTRYLLEEAEEEVMSKMVDLLVHYTEDSIVGDETSQVETSSEQKSEHPDDLFFIDTSVNADVALQFQNEHKKNDNDEAMLSDLDESPPGEQIDKQLELPVTVNDEEGTVSVIGRLPDDVWDKGDDGKIVLKSGCAITVPFMSDPGTDSDVFDYLSHDFIEENVSHNDGEVLLSSASNTEVINEVCDVVRSSGDECLTGSERRSVSIPDLSVHVTSSIAQRKRHNIRKQKSTSPTVPLTSRKSKKLSVFDFNSDSDASSLRSVRKYTKVVGKDSTVVKQVTVGTEPDTEEVQKTITKVNEGKGPGQVTCTRYSLRRFSESSHQSDNGDVSPMKRKSGWGDQHSLSQTPRGDSMSSPSGELKKMEALTPRKRSYNLRVRLKRV